MINRLNVGSDEWPRVLLLLFFFSDATTSWRQIECVRAYARVIDEQVRCASIIISLARGPMMYSSHTQIVTSFLFQLIRIQNWRSQDAAPMHDSLISVVEKSRYICFRVFRTTQLKWLWIYTQTMNIIKNTLWLDSNAVHNLMRNDSFCLSQYFPFSHFFFFL